MADLQCIFEDSGRTAVKTFIQSGNVNFSAPARKLPGLADRIAAEIATRHNCRTPVIFRTAAEIAETLSNNPFLATGADPKTLHVMFLRDQPDAQRAGPLDPQRSPGDTFALRRDLYLHLPNGAGNSKLTNAYIDSKLATIGATRNWNTVQKLAELMS